MSKLCQHVILTAVLLVAALSAHANQTYSGKVIAVSDGDTIKVWVDHQPLKIRLAEIDTPEKAQPYGNKAKQALSDLVYGKTVTVKQQTVDRYGRIVGEVFLNDIYVNAEMVKGGHAWVYRRYSKNPKLLELENDAKEHKRGLWASDYQVPPWEWRKAQREGKPIQGKLKPTGHSFTCGAKRYCKEMASCEEAYYYLTQCGRSRLDGDNDGVPCEKLCR